MEPEKTIIIMLTVDKVYTTGLCCESDGDNQKVLLCVIFVTNLGRTFFCAAGFDPDPH